MEKKEIFITPDGIKKIREELELLTNTKRLELAQRLRHAVEMGDLSENADYIKAKEDQAFLEGRIQELEYILREATIVEPQVQNDRVQIGSIVKISYAGGEPETFQIVGVTEANPRQGKISHESPIGKALVGKKAGDHAIVQTPAGESELLILEIQSN
jgi:transcription elongation factor GreA